MITFNRLVVNHPLYLNSSHSNFPKFAFVVPEKLKQGNLGWYIKDFLTWIAVLVSYNFIGYRLTRLMIKNVKFGLDGDATFLLILEKLEEVSIV